MNIDEIKPNSHAYKDAIKKKEEEKPERRLQKVTQGTVKKKGNLAKLKNSLISEDAGSIKDYILHSVLIPTVKNAIVDTVIDSVTMLFGCKGRTRSSASSRGAYVSYSSISSGRKHDRFSEEYKIRNSYELEEIILPTRSDAEEVLNQLCDCLATYDSVSVADLYDLVGIDSRYTDYDYGWTNLSTATYVHVRDGYVLKMPRPRPIK